MTKHKIEVPTLMEDNLRNYIQMLLGVSEFSDPDSQVTFQRSKGKYIVTIKPDTDEFRQSIIDNILYVNRNLKIPIKYSSSLALSKLVSFTIELSY